MKSSSFELKRPQPQICRLPMIHPLPFKKMMTLALASACVPLILATSATSAVTPDPNNIRITADKQSYNLAKKKYLLNGKVTVAFQDMQISGSTAEVDMDEAGKPQVAHFFNRPVFKRIKPQAGEDRVVGDVIKVFLRVVPAYFRRIAKSMAIALRS